MKRAFTLIETLCCIVIVSILTAISFPVFASALQSAHASSSLSNLHQLQIAFSLYRTENGGDARYGSPAAMGLPDLTALYRHDPSVLLPHTQGLWLSPCGQHPDTPPANISGTNLDYHVTGADGESWETYSQRKGEASVLIYDLNCNDVNVPLSARFFTKTLQAVRLDGSAFVKRTQGEVVDLDRWDP